MCSSNQTRGILGTVVPIVLGAITGGASFALAPWFGSTATSMLLGGAASAGLAGGKPSNWLTSGAMGALGGAGGAVLGRGATAGWSAASSTGKGLLGKSAGAVQGGLFGTGNVASPGVTQAAYGGGSTPVAFGGRGLPAAGLFGPGSLLAGTGNSLGQAAAVQYGASSILGMNKSQNKQITNDMYIPSSYYGANDSIPYPTTMMPIRPTPAPRLTYSDASQKANLFNLSSNSNSIIPGIKYQTSQITW